MSYAEYLALEATSETRHEYLRGEVWAMAGGTPSHSALAIAVASALTNALEGGPCLVFGSDLRVRVEATDLSTYPDLTVICGAVELSEPDPHAATNPVLIVEVLSDSTESYDRGQKFAHYRRLPSLREYLLVSQREPRIEPYSRHGESEWLLREAQAGETLTLASLEGVTLSIDRIYRNRLGIG